MKSDTKQYSNYIKSNNIVVTKDSFFDTNGLKHTLIKDSQGWWVDEYNEVYLTKKSAIYFTCKNNQTIPCGGCGATEEKQRCIGCFHKFK